MTRRAHLLACATALAPLLLAASACGASRTVVADPPVWNPNVDTGRYRNPVVFADYSDPDVVRVGDDYWMTASSFNASPALPILHSKDLVNWEIVNHAVPRLSAISPDFDAPQHGNGVWAPAIRHHRGEFHIYWGDPDRGIYMVKTRDPRGPWEPPVLVRAARGWIDPAPLWDDDGNAYLVHAFANSRAGIKSILHVARMSADGTRLLDDGTLVFDGRAHHPTIEGPKLYRRDGWYYIFAPAGGVRAGWQTVLRSRSPLGPYEDRVVLAQGGTAINGPHQGALVDTPNGDEWFVHFQDRGAYGRIVHLQPVAWKDGWPVMGADPDGDGTGEPVPEYRKPNVGRAHPVKVPQTSDEFYGERLGLQWQWHASQRPEWYSLPPRSGVLRLHAQPLPDSARSLWAVPNLLLQKLPAPAFTATTRLTLRAGAPHERAGLLVMGMDHASLAIARTASGFALVHARATDAHRGGTEREVARIVLGGATVHLRASFENPAGDTALVRFSYSEDGERWTRVGEPFVAREGRWIGAKVGLFAVRPPSSPAGGHADVAYFRIH